MSELNPSVAVWVQNDSGEDIPPRSVVVIQSVEITPQSVDQESIAIHHVVKYTGQAGNILITGPGKIPRASDPAASSQSASSRWYSTGKSYGWAYADMRIAAQIDPTISPPTPGEEWGPTSGQWYLTRGGRGFFADGYASNNASGSGSTGTLINNKQSTFMRGSRSSTTGGGGGGTDGGCGCCDCLDCIPTTSATVGGCAAAPRGAGFRNVIDIGEWHAYPLFTPDGFISLFYGGAVSCSSSSAFQISSSNAAGTGTTCMWYSCLFVVCNNGSSSSSSSSSSSVQCGIYQWQQLVYLDTNGKTATKILPVLMGGTDWLNICTGSFAGLPL